jgi:hypothetical protein
MKSILLAATLFVGSTSLSLAQENTVASGGNATGNGGSTSYSVGQVLYTTNTGANGSVAQGVQQPYEITVIAGVNETAIHLKLSVYPNPATNYIQLKVENEKLESLTYQLIDLQGKVINTEKVTASNTTIIMEALPKAIYLINIIKNNQLIKTFKIIKN